MKKEKITNLDLQRKIFGELNFFGIVLFFAVFTSLHSINAQNIGINQPNPDSSAVLDITSTDKGLLIPRVSLLSTTDVVSIHSPATSLLVYNTNATMTGGAIGFYYWNGTNWVTLGGSTTCAPAGAGETLINYNGCLYVKNTDEPGTYTWDNALTQCTNLTYAGETDWYLPSKMELDVLYQNFNQNNSQCQGGTCPLSGFNADLYWSSTSANSTLSTDYVPVLNHYIFTQYFTTANSGIIVKSNKTSTNYVRCVRR